KARGEIPIGSGLCRIGKHAEAERMCARYKRSAAARLLLLRWSEKVHFAANYANLRRESCLQKLQRGRISRQPEHRPNFRPLQSKRVFLVRHDRHRKTCER